MPVVLPLKLSGDELETSHASDIRRVVLEHGGVHAFRAVVTTTSCFAPRAPDDVVQVARLCDEFKLPHVINHAYGLQSSKLCHVVNEACRTGRVDAIVSSCDKNFMVPVGGAILIAPEAGLKLLRRVAEAYPGRASIAPALDLFITFMQMTIGGLQRLIAQRKEVAGVMREGLARIAARYGERLLESPRNPISFAISIDVITGRRGRVPAVEAGVDASAADGSAAAGATTASAGGAATVDTPEGPAAVFTAATSSSASSSRASTSSASYLGAMLFARGVSGTRVVLPEEVKTIEGVEFRGFGAQYDSYPTAYLTAAAAIGMTREDVTMYLDRLQRTIDAFLKQREKEEARKGAAAAGRAMGPTANAPDVAAVAPESLPVVESATMDAAEADAVAALLLKYGTSSAEGSDAEAAHRGERAGAAAL